LIKEKKIYSGAPGDLAPGPYRDLVEGTKKMADKIVDKNYQQNKNKSPFTQSAEVAKDLLSFEFKDGFITNKDGGKVDTFKEAIPHNEALDKNFQDHKREDYLKLIESNRLAQTESPSETWNRLDSNEKKRVHELRQKYDLDKMVHFGIENSSVKHPDYPRAAPKARLANVPILARNIKNYKIPKTPPTKTNATVERYKQFKKDKKFKEEEKEFNKNFEKEYGDKTIENHVLAKIKNKETLTMNEHFINGHIKDRAKATAHKQLAAIKIEPVKLSPTYIDYRLSVKDPAPTITLEEHLAKTAPIEADPLGITGVKGVRDFRNTVDISDQKFPKRSSGIAPFLSGEYDAN